MKAGFFMLAGCALLSACATRVPQAPQPILSRTVAVPSPTSQLLAASLYEEDLTKRYIRISGEVRQPGLYPWAPNTTLLRAIGAAGGSGFRMPTVLDIHREDGSVETYRLRAIEAGQTNDPRIYPNDHIHVPKRSALNW